MFKNYFDLLMVYLFGLSQDNNNSNQLNLIGRVITKINTFPELFDFLMNRIFESRISDRPKKLFINFMKMLKKYPDISFSEFIALKT